MSLSSLSRYSFCEHSRSLLLQNLERPPEDGVWNKQRPEQDHKDDPYNYYINTEIVCEAAAHTADHFIAFVAEQTPARNGGADGGLICWSSPFAVFTLICCCICCCLVGFKIFQRPMLLMMALISSSVIQVDPFFRRSWKSSNAAFYIIYDFIFTFFLGKIPVRAVGIIFQYLSKPLLQLVLPGPGNWYLLLVSWRNNWFCFWTLLPAVGSGL